MVRNGDRQMEIRINELFAVIKLNEDEFVTILRHSHEIGAAMDKEMK